MYNPSCSLIISTFNRPDALRYCLQSVFQQKKLPSNIYIADDGSGPETKQLIDEMQLKSPLPIIHIWQPDAGYQLAGIRNKAFAAADEEYLIQIDGDLILHPYFISDHLKLARRGTFISGARVMMNAALTARVLSGETALTSIPQQKSDLGKKYNGRWSPFLRTINYLFQRSRKNYKYVLGCNMAFWRSDLVAVNGYDESFSGWGKEDNDISIRLQNKGVKLRFLKFGGIIYHLHHPGADTSRMGTNEELLQKSIDGKITFVSKGMV